MKKFQKIYTFTISILFGINAHAETLNISPIYLKAPSTINWHQNGLIFLEPLQIGISYTITCDINNPNYNKKYPVIVGINSTKDIYDNKAVFSMNNIPLKYKQALMNQNINKFVAKNIIQSTRGASIGILNYDDSDAIYISNCIATPTV